jgi:N-acetylneuraminate synthase
MSGPVTIEGREIGGEAPALLIAELSANHDRDLDQALALVDIAAECGWDSVKFQTYDQDSLTVPSTHASMQIDPVWGADTLYELYKTAGMPMDFHAPLFERAREKGLLPFTSLYDPRDLDFVESLGVSVYKIASFEMTFDDLLEAIAGTGKPVVLSTGMANLAEVDHALEVLDRYGSGPVILLHCCSSYPAPVEEVNLRAMGQLAEKSGRPVGFSDHTIGSAVPLAAIAAGAVAIEKHFTNDPDRAGPDHRFSATPEVMREIAEGARTIHTALGRAEKTTTEAEAGNKETGRRSAFSLRPIPKGHVITGNDFRFVRPGVGIPANRKDAILGKTATRDIGAFEPIFFEDVS